MAEGGAEQVSGRREEFSRNCLPCSSKGTEIIAEKYCLVCERFFCQECTQLHNAVLGDHRLTEIESEDVTLALTPQMDTCTEHGRVRNLYCTDDDKACCEICIAKEHAACKEAVYLPKTAKEFLKDVDMDEVHAQLRKNIEQLESIKLNQATTMSSLEADRRQCLTQIDNHHTELLGLMDKITASSKDMVETTFRRFSTDLQRHHQEVEKGLVDLEESDLCLGRNEGNDVQLFVEIKKYQKHANAIEEVSTASLENLKVRGFSVAIDKRLQDLCVKLESMVTVLRHAPVQVTEKYKISIASNDDKDGITVYGVCVLDDGSVIVPDNSNKKLKHIDTNSRNIIGQLAMQTRPNVVCHINHNEVAVTQGNNTVALVSVKPRLTVTRTISMDHYCAYITYSHEQMFINDGKQTLYIYDMAGSLVKKIATGPSGEEIFSKIRHVVLNDEGDKLYVADLDKGIVTMDRQGNELDKMVSDKIRNAQGVCLDGIGGLFVCGYNSNNVIHVGPDGRILAEVLTSSDGLRKSTSVFFDRVRKRLIVSKVADEQLCVYELE